VKKNSLIMLLYILSPILYAASLDVADCRCEEYVDIGDGARKKSCFFGNMTIEQAYATAVGSCQKSELGLEKLLRTELPKKSTVEKYENDVVIANFERHGNDKMVLEITFNHWSSASTKWEFVRQAGGTEVVYFVFPD
jgi:hypothetical protein